LEDKTMLCSVPQYYGMLRHPVPTQVPEVLEHYVE
jgi:hypothetical protein